MEEVVHDGDACEAEILGRPGEPAHVTRDAGRSAGSGEIRDGDAEVHASLSLCWVLGAGCWG
ncbi:hypothetical protein [Streptomyces sp. LN325]|uniref:hypothetical protein n=1 Tax=Streptomyces sp. LN325 TaxID=3112976 RepID=UPI003719260F